MLMSSGIGISVKDLTARYKDKCLSISLNKVMVETEAVKSGFMG